MDTNCRDQTQRSADTPTQLGHLVDQWVFDYYFRCAVEAFRSDRRDDFQQIRDILSVLMVRPLTRTTENDRKVRIMQCFSRIEEGEDPDCQFDEDKNETPLESALWVLDLVQKEFSVNQDLLKANKQMIKEANLRDKLQAIIHEKNLKHPLITKFSFGTLKKKIYELFENQIDEKTPFLLTVAQNKQRLKYLSEKPAQKEKRTKCLSEEPAQHEQTSQCLFEETTQMERMTESSSEEPAQREQKLQSLSEEPAQREQKLQSLSEEPAQREQKLQSLSEEPAQREHLLECFSEQLHTCKEPTQQRNNVSHPQTERPVSLQVVRPIEDIETAYSLSLIRSQFISLNKDKDSDITFTTLFETDFFRQDSPMKIISENPDTSVLLEQKKRLVVSVKKLAMEEDNQSKHLNETTNFSLTHEKKDQIEPLKQKPLNQNHSSKKRKKNYPLDRSNVFEEYDTWSEEDDLFKSNRNEKNSNNTTTNSKRQKWTQEETEWIKSGVKKFGEGNWKCILQKYPFQKRSTVMIKDRWRTMKKLGLAED
ncbi:hypothetical protein GDO86_008283 [Hymenochirus boettgeri]|uniref:Telomeric repeat-binding factor n=1 Tax=Hymenochirus boettgeri TaxID=247094 RepID=A0A8T2J533_9PIPI|nr:hypothetical protein GDO86_008283 [Hymenochirus boettgeri]